MKQKWTEFKGHDINPETLKFKLNKHGNILYVDINGETESLTPIMINSILEGGENTKDVNFNNTGLSFNVFISKLKDAGFPSEKLSVDAKKVYDGEKTIDNPVDNTPNIQDAILALTTLGWSKEKAEKTVAGIVSVVGNTKPTEFYTHKALKPNSKEEYESKPETVQSTPPKLQPKKNEPESSGNNTPEVEIEGNKIKFGDKSYKIGSFLPPKLLNIIKSSYYY